MELEKDKAKSSKRDQIYEFIFLLEGQADTKDPKEVLDRNIIELKESYQKKKEKIGPSIKADHGPLARKVDELNELFNQIKILESLQGNFDIHRQDLTKLVNDLNFREKTKKEIEEIDYNEEPSFFSSLVDTISVMLGLKSRKK